MTLETPRTALLNLAPCTWNMAIPAINRPIFQSMGFPCNQRWILSPWCCLNRQKACQPQNMANSEKTAKKSPKTKKPGQKMKKNIFEKIRNFSALDERDCQAAWLFCTLGPIWSRNARLARWGRSTPFPHAHRENRPIFQNKGFPLNLSWIMCRRTLQDR